MTYNGLTGADESCKGFLGSAPYFRNTSDGKLSCFFDVGFGVNDPLSGRHGTWRHCIAYSDIAEKMRGMRGGAFLKVAGWITTNPVWDSSGKRAYSLDGKPVTREYLIVNEVIRLTREKTKQTKQLSFVE
jgi:hypothetical protein